MDAETLALRLRELAESLQIEVRVGPAESAGGLVVLRDKKVAFVPKGALASREVQILSRALAQADLEGVFVVPAVREAIERARGQTGASGAK